MPRRSRRPLTLLASALLIPALAACGSDDGDTGSGLGEVEVAGELGETPEVTWPDDYTAGQPECETIIEGDGPEIAADGTALVHYWIGNGFDQSEAISTYTALPEALDLTDTELPEALTDPVVGATVGSRIVTSLDAEELFGPVGQPAYGISNKDPLLLVTDVLGPYPIEEPYEEQGSGFAPDLVLGEDGTPTAMRFAGRPKPTGRLQVQTLVEGDGETIKASDVVMVDYLGSVYAKPKPFDTSFGADPLVQSLSGLVEGWQRALVGKTVGSRVVIAVPPALGYGAEGNEGAGIKGTDTIYFLIDVLARAPKPATPEPTASPSASASIDPSASGSPSPAVSPGGSGGASTSPSASPSASE